MANTERLHPTPNHRRRAWTDLRGTWEFAFDDDDQGRYMGWSNSASRFERSIAVPYPPESPLSGIADPSPHPVVWYRRSFRSERPTGDHRVLLRFGAVDYAAAVWINGVFVGSHEGGNTSFAFDITDALGEGGKQVVVVRAADDPGDIAQPRGKQFWEPEPRGIWYHRTTGIWQPVWVEVVPQTHVTEISWTPRSGSALALRLRLSRDPRRGDHIRVRISLRGEALVDDVYRLSSRELERRVSLEPFMREAGRQRLTWEPAHPNLLDTVVTLEDESGNVMDEVHGYVGLRTVGTSDGLFTLNGIPRYLRLVLSQGYWPESHLAAPSDEAIRAEVEWIKRLGFNGVRIHQKVEDPRFLYWCDRLGVLVWSEMASAYVFSDVAAERLVREWLEVIRRDHGHPSIVTWVPFNESWGVPDMPDDPAQRDLVRALYHLTKALDPSRLVVDNDGWEHVAGDIIGIHDYTQEGATLVERYGSSEAITATLSHVRPHHRRLLLDGFARASQPLVLSEFGGISFPPEPGKPWFGYGTVKDADGFLQKYQELVGSVLASPGLAGFCYTQLADTEQESNGLLTAARQPKVDPDRISAITGAAARAIPGDVVASFAVDADTGVKRKGA